MLSVWFLPTAVRRSSLEGALLYVGLPAVAAGISGALLGYCAIGPRSRNGGLKALGYGFGTTLLAIILHGMGRCLLSRWRSQSCQLVFRPLRVWPC